MIRVTEMKAGLQVVEEPPDLSELTRLSDYLNGHIEVFLQCPSHPSDRQSDLHPALLGRAVALIQEALGKPESYLINEDDGHTLNVCFHSSIIIIIIIIIDYHTGEDN